MKQTASVSSSDRIGGFEKLTAEHDHKVNEKLRELAAAGHSNFEQAVAITAESPFIYIMTTISYAPSSTE